MTVTAQSFRANFPAFKSAQQYPDATINFWIGVAGTLLNASRWFDTLDFGTQLFVAHNLSLEAFNNQAGANGAPPGDKVGPANNKSVDKASVGYDTGSGIEEGAGHWNLTNYGTRFIQLAKMMGAGPVQIGMGGPGQGFTNAAGGQAYVGPWPWNFPNQNM